MEMYGHVRDIRCAFCGGPFTPPDPFHREWEDGGEDYWDGESYDPDLISDQGIFSFWKTGG